MPTYVYACSTHTAHREEVIHSMQDSPVIPCPLCGEQMHRIPQVFRYYLNPKDVLCDMLDDKYVKYRAEKERQKHAN